MRLMGLPSCTTSLPFKAGLVGSSDIRSLGGGSPLDIRQLGESWNVPWGALGARARGSRGGPPRMDQKARARTVERAQPYRRWGRSSSGRGRETDMGRVTSARDDSFLTGALPNGMPL